MIFENDRSGDPWKTIDKERDITLIEKGLDRDLNARDFELDIEGEKVYFTALKRGIEGANVPVNSDVKWIVIRMGPLHINEKETKKLIEEALRAYGSIHHRERIKLFEIEFDIKNA